jgi:hypothetical protein
MLEDGIVNAGRLYVLYVFTQTYCAEYKDRVCDIWIAYYRVVEGLRCVPSSTNQQPGHLTNQTSPFPADQPIRNQENEPIRKQDTIRNNRLTPSIQSLHSMKSKDKRAETHTSFDMSRKSKSQTKALNIPFTLTQGIWCRKS